MQSEQKGFVPCDHEYLNFKGGKFSRSRGAAVDVPCFLSKYEPDPLREPAPLLKTLDESLVEEEYARLEGWATEQDFVRIGAPRCRRGGTPFAERME